MRSRGIRDERLARIRSREGGWRTLRPGASIGIGRHRDNQVSLEDSAISRFHARIAWDAREPRPELIDLRSQNGTLLNGHPVSRAILAHGDRIEVGGSTLLVDLEGCNDTPALLEGVNDVVSLFTDLQVELSGKTESNAELQRILRRLEETRRTGTLRLSGWGTSASLVFCLGRIMSGSQDGERLDLRGLRELALGAESVHFAFYGEFEVDDAAQRLEIRPRELLMSRQQT